MEIVLTNTDRVTRSPSSIVTPQGAALAQSFLRWLFRLLGGITVLGAENVPSSGPVLICPNHLSDCDPHAVYATSGRADNRFVTKSDLFDDPWLRPVLHRFGSISIKRDTADIRAVKEIISVLRAGSAVTLFPEGRLSESGELQRIQPGAALIAIKSRSPVIPVGLFRTNLFLPYGETLPHPSHLPARVIYGKPIDPAEYGHLSGRRAVNALTDRIEGEIRGLTRQ